MAKPIGCPNCGPVTELRVSRLFNVSDQVDYLYDVDLATDHAEQTGFKEYVGGSELVEEEVHCGRCGELLTGDTGVLGLPEGTF